LTSVGEDPKMGKKSNRQSKEDLDATNFQEYASKQEPEEDDGRASDIDFNDDYSDDEMQIKFKNSRDVITYLHGLEDDNLFKVMVN